MVEKGSLPEEEVEDLGDYYFSKVHQVVVRKNTNKRNLYQSGEDVIIAKASKSVWHFSNQPEKMIANETTKVLFSFGDDNKKTLRNMLDECN